MHGWSNGRPIVFLLRVYIVVLLTDSILNSSHRYHRQLRFVTIVEAMIDGVTLTKNGEIDQNELAKWVRQATRMGLTGEDAAKLAAFK